MNYEVILYIFIFYKSNNHIMAKYLRAETFTNKHLSSYMKSLTLNLGGQFGWVDLSLYEYVEVFWSSASPVQVLRMRNT